MFCKETLTSVVSFIAVLGLVAVGIYDAVYRDNYEIIKNIGNIALIYLFGTAYGRVLSRKSDG